METGKEQQNIQQLKELRGQLRAWKTGLLCTALAAVVLTIGSVHSSVNALVQKGPTQEKFVKLVSEGIQEDVAPILSDMAKQTLNEVKPEVEASIERVNARMPELAQASLAELETMQDNLAKRGTVVLERTFVAMLQKKEDELKEMFPEATPEQIERLLTNLGESAGQEASEAAVEMFGRHHEKLEQINANLELIAEKERPHLQNVDPSWEMGLLVLDLFREDLNRMRPDQPQLAKGQAPKATAVSQKAKPQNPKEYGSASVTLKSAREVKK